MNYSKYHQTANFTTSGGQPSGSAHNNSNSHHNFGPAANNGGARASSNSRIYSHHHQGSNSNIREGQSVERLKSCIADLKKLATNKVKRGSSQAPHMAGGSKRDRASHHNTATPEDSSLGYQYGGTSRDTAPGTGYQQHLYQGGGNNN